MYDMDTGTWTALAKMNLPRLYPLCKAHNHPDFGEVIVVAGSFTTNFVPTSTAEIYTVGLNAWRFVDSMPGENSKAIAVQNSIWLMIYRVEEKRVFRFNVANLTWVEHKPGLVNTGTQNSLDPGHAFLVSEAGYQCA